MLYAYIAENIYEFDSNGDLDRFVLEYQLEIMFTGN